MKMLRILLICAAGLAPLLAVAQWQWLDKDGRKVFSDRAPPDDVPAKNILKRPQGKAATAPAADADAGANAPAVPNSAAASASKPAGNLPKLRTQDVELEAKKKQAEAAAAEKRRLEGERQAAAKAENCSRARQNKALYDSGTRIARMSQKGEREVLDDTARSAESKRMQTLIDTECTPTPKAQDN